MNKEEREIIYTLEGSINTYIEGTKVTKVQLSIKQSEILLNLIYKLQEENLKYKNYEYNKALIQQNNNLKDRISELQEENEKLKNDNQVLKETLYGGNVSE